MELCALGLPLLWWFLIVVTAQESCYSNDSDPYVLFATKTSYFEVDNEDRAPVEYQGCEAKSVWMMVRHGTRNPGDDDIELMAERGPELQQEVLQNHQAGRGNLCESDLDNLESWEVTLTIDDESLLTGSGKLEQEQLGVRFRARFPGLLDQPFERSRYQIRHTIKERAEASAKAYVQGAFPGEDVYIDPPLEEDPLLRYYDFCTKWISEVDDNNATYVEQETFVNSAEMQEAIQRVSDRLGFPQPLEFVDILLMYDTCRYERSFRPQEPSPWCAAFDEEDLIVMEYHQDLEYWYKNGYANELNYKMSCPLMEDMVDTFSENSTNRRLGTFYFSHSEALLPFLGLLGLYRDEDVPTHDNFADMRERYYRTSLIGSFSAGVAFVLFDCQGEQKVLTLHQEVPVQLPKCSDLLCDWEQFNTQFQDDIDCQFAEMCDVQGDPKAEGDRRYHEKSGKGGGVKHDLSLLSLAIASLTSLVM